MGRSFHTGAGTGSAVSQLAQKLVHPCTKQDRLLRVTATSEPRPPQPPQPPHRARRSRVTATAGVRSRWRRARRRERRVRSWLRHERMTVATALAEQLLHSVIKVERDAALRRQTTRAREDGGPRGAPRPTGTDATSPGGRGQSGCQTLKSRWGCWSIRARHLARRPCL